MKMRNILTVFMIMGILGLYSCDIEKKHDGELPSIDIDTEAGMLPDYDIEWADIDVGTTTKIIKVPTVEIVMEEREIEVPFIDASWPTEYDNVAEQTITVAADVSGYKYDMEIQEIYAKGDVLIVVSSLEKEDEEIGNNVMRVSDQVVVNAPELTVKHYIIGDKPDRGFNDNYIYVSDKSALETKLENADKIYG